MRLTAEWLESKDACTSAVTPFLAAFCDGADLTRELLGHATVQPHLDWLAKNLRLTAPARATYEAARAEPNRVWDAAMAEADRVWAAARAEPNRVWDAARAEADRVLAAAMAEPNRVWAAARAEALWVAIVASGLDDDRKGN